MLEKKYTKKKMKKKYEKEVLSVNSLIEMVV